MDGEAGGGFGLPEWFGMTYDARNAATPGVTSFPHWLRQTRGVPKAA